MNIVQSGEANKRNKNGLFYEEIVDHFNKIFYSLGNAPQAHPHRRGATREVDKIINCVMITYAHGKCSKNNQKYREIRAG